MNSDTIIALSGGTGRNQIASQTLASTTETEFRVNTDNGSGAIAVLQMPQQGAIVGSFTPQSAGNGGNAAILGPDYGSPYGGFLGQTSAPWWSTFDGGRPFLVRLCGVATPASNAANSLTLKVYQGTSKSGQNILTTGAITTTESTTAAASFVIESECYWDSGSGLLNGQFWFSINTATPTYHVWQANSAVPTAVTAATLQFCASATWGNAVGGQIAVSEFSLTQL